MKDTQPTIDHIKSQSTKDLIKEFGGWVEGHVVFENGEHGNGYVDNLRFLRHPLVMTEMGHRLAEQFIGNQDEIDVVVGPSIIGAIIAYSVSNHLNRPFTTTYSDYRTREMSFHRGFIPPEGSRCLFVDDFIFSGRCVRDNVNFMQRVGLTVVGISVIGIRRPLETNIPLKSLIEIDLVKTSAENCTLCQANIPIKFYDIRE